jgi:hypothetical protein
LLDCNARGTKIAEFEADVERSEVRGQIAEVKSHGPEICAALTFDL